MQQTLSSTVYKPLMLLAIFSVFGAACGGPSTSTRPVANRKAPSSPPAWVQGDYPSEEAFFGHGKAPMTDQGSEQARALAKEAGVTNVQLELQLLIKALKADYEEVVAVDPSVYALDSMFADIDRAGTEAVAQAAITETWVDNSRTPTVVHVLVKLPVATYYTILFEAIPEEPEQRIKNYEATFTQAVMEGLGR